MCPASSNYHSGDSRRVSLLNTLNQPNHANQVGGGSLQTSPNMQSKLKALPIGKRKGSADDAAANQKTDKRRTDKRLTADLQALFDAVEHQDLEQVQILLGNNIEINSLNSDDFTLLDIASMTNNIPIAKLLLRHGAKYNPKFINMEVRAQHITTLTNEAAKRTIELTSVVINAATGRGNNISTSQQKENERQLSIWEFKHRLLKRMKAGFEHTKPPDKVNNVVLSVVNNSSLMVTFSKPDNCNGACITRYKVEWSNHEDFSEIAGELAIEDSFQNNCTIDGLKQGSAYYVRMAALNIKGFSEYVCSCPPFAVPSSWRDVDQILPRLHGKLASLSNLFHDIKDARPADASELKDTGLASGPDTSPAHQKKPNHMKKSFKNLFTGNPKFQKLLKRGVYLSVLFYNEDRILVTAEENLPIIEVDDNYSGLNPYNDLHWMLKVACTWDDVKSLRQDMDKSSSSNTVHFRSKLLQSAAQFQNALGIQDLGQFFYRPTKDSNGSILLTVINHVKDSKMVNPTWGKWISLTKLYKKLPTSASTDCLSAIERTTACITEMIDYHKCSKKTLMKGLYLGYLKLQSTVDLIKVLVPQESPNMLPNVKIRDNSNVSKEEWELLQHLCVKDIQKGLPSNAQLDFQEQLISSCHRLLSKLGISDDEAISHRMYDVEVIELSSECSFVILLPPVESVCSVPCYSEDFCGQHGSIALPVQVFEIVHMSAYENEFISRYSRLSSILEMDMHLSQQALREAFSDEEIADAKDRLEKLSNCQSRLEGIWKGMRWTMDIISYGRDKNIRGGIPLGVLYAPPATPDHSPEMYRRDIDIVTSSASDLGYHSDRNSADFNMDGHSINSKENSINSDIEAIENIGDTSVTSGYSSHSMTDDSSSLYSSKDSSSSLLSASSISSNATASVSRSIPGVLRIYAAYDTGLSKTTSVKLHVTPRTTSREVVELVVQQLNRAIRVKNVNAPYYSDEQLDEFCLVAVIGARERVLRDDYQPLQLQNPWTKGRLYVRLKTNILAALEQGQGTAV
ncbi:ankyrin repeat and fibronectin type-III domain-containing protein 1-like isoform X2 [Tubulanus polymorphus]